MAIGSTGVTAQSRASLRRQMKTSMFGARAGMDFNDYEVGEEDTRLPVEVITTTVASSFIANGFTLIATTAASSASYTLQSPVSGIYKTITQLSSSTAGFLVNFGATANIVTSAGSSFTNVTLAGVGHTLSVTCVSTAGGSQGGPVWISATVASPGISFAT
jgi:hypothetical protein